MTEITKADTKVVKVIRGLSQPGRQVPALVHARGGRHGKRQHLSPEVEGRLGEDLFGYFEAEFLAGIWWIGERLPNGDRGW